jgi:hypothetical protein
VALYDRTSSPRYILRGCAWCKALRIDPFQRKLGPPMKAPGDSKPSRGLAKIIATWPSTSSLTISSVPGQRCCLRIREVRLANHCSLRCAHLFDVKFAGISVSCNDMVGKVKCSIEPGIPESKPSSTLTRNLALGASFQLPRVARCEEAPPIRMPF